MRTPLLVVGAVLALAGLVFVGQGLGYIKGSVMTGDPHWVGGGAIFVIAGAVIAFTGLRRSRA